MKRLSTIVAAVVCCGLACARAMAATTYTWLDSPVNATWDTSSLNWSDGTTSGVAWVNGNDAVFPASSSKRTIGFSGTIMVRDMTLNGAYTFNGSPVVTGKLTANTGSPALAYCLGGESVRIGGPSSTTLYMGHAGTATLKTMTLEDAITIAPNGIQCFGPEPATPITNVVVTGTKPSIYANSTSLNFSENRIIRIASGSKLYIGASGDDRTITVHKIDVDLPSGQDFSSNTAIGIPNYWKGNFVFDPGANWTNNIGQLLVCRNLTIKSGTTRLGSAASNKTADDALMHVQGAASFSGSRRLVVDNATLYSSQSSRYVDVNNYGWVVVTNGGKVIMPGVHWLNGLSTPGRLDVTDGGEFQVEVLRVSQSSNSQIHLDEGGTIKTSMLFMDTLSTATFTFDGGTFQSTADGDGRGLFGGAGKWANVTFAVGAKGAVFNAAGQNIFWDRPLMSGVADGTDGGIRTIGGKLFLIRAKNSYTGPTVVEGTGTFCPRVDDALPPGTTVRLSGGAALDFHSYETMDPARDSTNWVGRLEGYGNINNCSALHVTNAIAPSIGGSLGFAKVCDLRGDYEISANATSCGRIWLNAAGQDISGLKPRLINVENFDRKMKYEILRSPNGHVGAFDERALPPGWKLTDTGTQVVLSFNQGSIIVFR